MSGFTSQRNWLHTLLYRRRRSGLVTGAMLLLAAESQGLALDFAGSRASGPSAQIKDTGTPANNYTSQGRVSNGALVGPGGKLTYASPSPKLCLQSDGTYKYQAHNLVLRSEDISNASWAKTAATVSGTDQIVENSATSGHYILQAPTLVAGETFTISVEALRTSRSFLWIGVNYASGANAFFNLSTGATATVGAGLTASIVDAGGGYYKCSVTFAVVTGASNVIFGFPPTDNTFSWAGDGASGGILRKFHVRRANSNPDYIATTSAALYDLPYEYDTSGNPLGIRVEEARTNLALRAQEFDNASWTKSNFTITANAVVAPDGNTTADQLTATAGGNQLFQLPTLADSSNYTGSFYVKKSVGNWVYILFRDKANVINTAWFNIGTGAKGSTAGTISAYTIDALSNSWYRISATFNSATGAASPLFYFGTATGDTVANGTAGDSVYLWQAQLELGSFATSPIVTAGSTVTRAADTITLATTLFPYSDTAGSAYARYISRGAISAIISASGTFPVYGFGGTGLPASYDSANIAQGTGASSDGVEYKHASAWSGTTNGLRVCRNAGTVAKNTFDGSMTASTFGFGIRPTVGQSSTMHLKHVVILPRDYSDAELQSVTT